SQKPLFKQMAKAVAHLHSRKIVHGDIKEENILIGTKSGRLVAKLCDFGHSFKIFDSQPKMKLYGTKVVTSPELLLNSNKSDSEVQKYTGFAQDIWALGIVLYTMLHGNIPPE
ncbi:kinase-like domain-containing protein, partial [Globomyces pollinis-pini]